MYDDENDYGESPDDMLESTRFNPLNARVGDNPLPEDNDRPAAPARKPRAHSDAEVDEPFADTNVEIGEAYEEGPHGPASVTDQSIARSGRDWVMIHRWEDAS